MFGERIKQVRKQMKLSQAEFANNLGISRAHVSKLEIGQAVPSRQLLNLISQIYLIRVEWLVDGIGPMELDINRNGKIVHKMACASLQKQLELFLNLHGELMCYVTEALRDGSKDLVPGLCPPELLDRLHQILKIPYDNDLLALVRRILVACESNANAEDPGVTR
jgi:transcriptional regulator with XRE-family HTH domain